MVACLESLFFANCSNIIRSVASLVLEASESDKDGEISTKIEIFPFRHSYATAVTHLAYLFAVMDSPCAQLVRLREASQLYRCHAAGISQNK
jgi:hypothetical protein